MTAPATTAGGPEYHVSQLDSYGMTGKRQTCVEGMGALRNLRDLAKDHRGDFIQTANARAQQSGQEDNAASRAGGSNDYATSRDLDKEPDLPGYLYPEDDQQDGSPASTSFETVVEPPTSFTTSLTSNFSTRETRSKRHRVSQSPPSSRPKKHGSANDRTSYDTATPGHQGGSGDKQERSQRKSRLAGSEITKANPPISTAEDGNDWEWDKGMEKYRCWNKVRWEYWDEEYEAKKYWDGKKWQWVA